MVRVFCDRCEEETAEFLTVALSGAQQSQFDLCPACRTDFVRWVERSPLALAAARPVPKDGGRNG